MWRGWNDCGDREMTITFATIELNVFICSYNKNLTHKEKFDIKYKDDANWSNSTTTIIKQNFKHKVCFKNYNGSILVEVFKWKLYEMLPHPYLLTSPLNSTPLSA